MFAKDNFHTKYKTVFIASDHAGFELKDHLIKHFPQVPWIDLGPSAGTSVDYPDYAEKLCLELKGNLQNSCGVLVCGSGQGMAIRANRFKFIRAALCWDEEVAKLSREHNDANVLCLGGRMIPTVDAEKIFKSFMIAEFAGGRHQARVDKLSRGE